MGRPSQRRTRLYLILGTFLESTEVDLKRHDQILELAASGLTDKQIAKRLEIAPGTVETHWKRIRARYGSSSRSAAIAQWMSSRAGSDTEQLEKVIQEMTRYIESLHLESGRSESVRKQLRTLEMGWAASRSMVYVYDLNEVSQFIYMSESVRVFGWEPSDWTEGRVDIAKVVHPDDIPAIFAARQVSVPRGSGRKATSFESRHPATDTSGSTTDRFAPGSPCLSRVWPLG